jgi:hypothetical protein
MNLYYPGWRLWDLAWLPSMHLQESEQILTFSELANYQQELSTFIKKIGTLSSVNV